MALSFLNNIAQSMVNNPFDDIMGGVKQGSNIAQGVFDLLNVFKKPKQNTYNPAEEAYYNALNIATNQRPTEAENRSRSLYEALLQPNNSLVRQQQEEGTQLGVDGLLRQIREFQNADRRAVARGRRGGTFSDPERRDEFLDYSVSRGLPYIQQQALNDARTNIGNQANNIQGQANGQIVRQLSSKNAMLTDAARQIQMAGKPYTETYYPQYQNKIMSGLNTAGDVFGGIDKLLKTLQGSSKNTKVYGPTR